MAVAAESPVVQMAMPQARDSMGQAALPSMEEEMCMSPMKTITRCEW